MTGRHLGTAAVILAVLVAGCKPSQPVVIIPDKESAEDDKGPPPDPIAPKTQGTGAATPDLTATEEFLRAAVADPKAAAARLAPDFKKIFPSDDALAAWLGEQVRGLTNFAPFSRVESDGVVSLRGTAKRAGKPVTVALRLGQDANKTWQVRRLLIDMVGVGTPQGSPAGLEWAQEEAVDFLQAFLTAEPRGEFGLALAAMTDGFKARLGANDDARREWLRPRREGFAGGVVGRGAPGPGDNSLRRVGATIEACGDLYGPKGRSHYTLKMTRVGTAWRADSLEISEPRPDTVGR